MTTPPDPTPAPSTARYARAVLMRLSRGVPTPPLGELILRVGPNSAAETLLHDPAAAAADYGVIVDPDAAERAAADLEHAAELGARLLTPEDPDWPRSAALVAWQRSTGQIASLVEVPGLWVRGPGPLAGGGRRVAVAGAHACSDYGRHVARDWAAALTDAGIGVVTSGGSGIDAEALRGALAAHGTPVIITPGGLDRAHPAIDRELFEAVAERGTVVSPYPLGTAPDRARSVGRRTMIAGFGRDATLLVEAGLRCPALHTAHDAHAMGRRVLVVPGPVTAATSAGAHRLAREPWAQLVGSVDDVLADLRRQPEVLSDITTALAGPDTSIASATYG